MLMLFSFLIGFLLTGLCVSNENDGSEHEFTVEYQWTYINFTWENEDTYEDAITTQRYIPENNAMAGIKYYKNKFYIAMPRIRDGSPVTLGYISTEDNTKINPLIAPFPSWEMHQFGDCEIYLESVQSMEIDSNGIMWLIDGHRRDPNTKCPPKLLLIDLNDNNKILHSFIFPEEICSSHGGFLNDIVVDDSDGGFAYISEQSSYPGLIIYSKSQDKAWKIRDVSMDGEVGAPSFVVDGHVCSGQSAVDGIALSPYDQNNSRSVYYCPLGGLNLYSISTDILKDEELCMGDSWKNEVKHIGAKQAQSDGLVIDNTGDLYYGLLPLYGVGKWNIYERFSTAEIVDQNNETMIWTDSFAMDNEGYLYLLTNNIDKFFDKSYKLEVTDRIMFRILKFFTSTKSYLYP